MSRLTIELPSELGRNERTTDARRSADLSSTLDEAVVTFVRWFDCWAGR